jgi:cell division protein FtsI (penicillin-binding protein 3)
MPDGSRLPGGDRHDRDNRDERDQRGPRETHGARGGRGARKDRRSRAEEHPRPDRHAGRDRPAREKPRSLGAAADRGRVRRPRRGSRRPASARRTVVRRADQGRRLGAALVCIAIVISLFAGRLVQLQGFDSGGYRQLAQNQRLDTIPLPALRGPITAANGQVLAMTVQTYLVYADPAEMTATQMPQVAAALAGPLGMSQAAILSLLQRPTSPQYVVLKRGMSQQAADQINGLGLPGKTNGLGLPSTVSSGACTGKSLTGLPGIAMTASCSRSYPDGGSASNLIGFTNTTSSGNLAGEAGLEYADNSLLAGQPGSEQVQVSGYPGESEPIPLAGGKDTPAVDGSGLRLTIIPALQWEAQQACEQEVSKSRADNCTVVVMQPHTGRILAMAQWPAYDPDDTANPQAQSDLAVQDVFEPGSTAKVITAAAAMEHGGQTIDSVYTVPDQITEDGYSFQDAEYHPVERWTIAGILANSSNDGMVQVVRHVSPQIQYDYLKAFGLGTLTGLNLPGETPGLLAAPSQWWGDQRYTLSFGQGVAVNAVQMASVYATIANGGVRVQPTLVLGTTNSSGHYTPALPSPSRRVIQPKTAWALIGALEQVPAVDEQADQPWGIIPGYAIAAKTGTSQEVSGNCLCKFGASYIGMAPGNNPQLVVAVNVQNPRKGGYYGDIAAGPVFYQVMRFALQTMKIPPDGAKPANVPLTGP